MCLCCNKINEEFLGEFKPNECSDDDEETIAKEEGDVKDVAQEVNLLQQESEMDMQTIEEPPRSR